MNLHINTTVIVVVVVYGYCWIEIS